MTDNRTQATKAYIHSFLNEKISVRPLPMDLQKSTPFVLKSNYSCFSSAIMEKKVVLCYPKDEKTTTPSKVHRHLEMLESLTQHPAILVLTEVPSYNIKRLIDQRVNFIINGKQMFVPSLLMDLRKLGLQYAVLLGIGSHHPHLRRTERFGRHPGREQDRGSGRHYPFRHRQRPAQVRKRRP